MENILRPTGSLSIYRRADDWILRNVSRKAYIMGWWYNHVAKLFSRATGIPTITSQLSGMLQKNGTYYDLGVMGYRVVTTAGVNFLVDAWQTTTEMDALIYHGCGTGTGAEAIGDTALGTECSAAGIIDITLCTGGAYRPAGTAIEGSATNIFKTVATIGFDGGGDITEHGILSATSTGTLWDRTKFVAVSVVATNTLVFTYEATVAAGG